MLPPAAQPFELRPSFIRFLPADGTCALESPRIGSNHLARSMTRKPFQSKLRPHLEFIRECRAQEMSYPQIAAELRARFDLSAAPSTIFAFVKVRAHRRSVITLLASEPAPAVSVSAQPAPPAKHVRPTTKANAPVTWNFYDPTKPLEKLPPSS